MESGTSTMLIMAGGVMVAVAIIVLGTALKTKVGEVQDKVIDAIDNAIKPVPKPGN